MTFQELKRTNLYENGLIVAVCCAVVAAGWVAIEIVDNHYDSQPAWSFEYEEVERYAKTYPSMGPAIAKAIEDNVLTDGEYDDLQELSSLQADYTQAQKIRAALGQPR